MVILRTLLEIAAILLNVLWWLIIIQVILSWLVAFNVLNTQSEGMRRFLVGLDRFLDLRLRSAIGDPEHNRIVLGQHRRLFGDVRGEDDVVVTRVDRYLLLLSH